MIGCEMLVTIFRERRLVRDWRESRLDGIQYRLRRFASRRRSKYRLAYSYRSATKGSTCAARRAGM